MLIRIHANTDPVTGGRMPAHGMSIEAAPTKGRHYFTRRWLDKYKQFVQVTDDAVILNTLSHGAVVFPIEWKPGTWCLHCGEKLPDTISYRDNDEQAGKNAEAAKKHVATHKAPSPRSDWEHGYITVTRNDLHCLVPEGLVGIYDTDERVAGFVAPEGVLEKAS